MTDKPDEEQPQQVFVPGTAQAAPETEEKKENGKPEKKADDKGEGAPVGQIAAGGIGATVLGSYALASVVGPAGWLAAPAAAAAGGAGYVAYRRRKKKGAKSERRTEKTTTSKGSSSTGRLGGLGGGSRAGSPASGRGSGGGSAGARPSSGRTASGGTSGGGSKGGGSSARPGSGSSRPGSGGKGGGKPPSSSGGGRPGSSSPRGGGSPRGSSPRGGSATRGSSGRGSGTSPGSKPGGMPGRGSGGRGRSGATGGPDGVPSSKKKPGNPNTPNGRGGKPRSGTGGGNMPNDRQGKSPAADDKPGWFRRRAGRAGNWADEKTGRRVSTGWRGAKGHQGFNNRRRAAGQAVKDAGGGGFVAGLVGVIVAVFAAIAGLFGAAKPWAERQLDSVDPDAKQPNGNEGPDEGKPAATGSGGGPQPNRKSPPTPPQGGPKTDDQQPDQKPNEAPSGAPTGGNTMSGLPASQIAHDMAGAMARYEPADAYQVVPDARQWADVPTQVAMSVKAYADRLEGSRFPLNQAINDKLREFAQALAATRSIAEEIEPLMRKAHADDLARQESPRGDESKWNI